MAWYQPGDFQIVFMDSVDSSRGSIGSLPFSAKIKLFVWNRLLPSPLRIRLVNSSLHQWVCRD